MDEDEHQKERSVYCQLSHGGFLSADWLYHPSLLVCEVEAVHSCLYYH